MASTNTNKNIHNTQNIDDGEDEAGATEMAENRIKPFEKRKKIKSTIWFFNIIGFHDALM